MVDGSIGGFKKWKYVGFILLKEFASGVKGCRAQECFELWSSFVGDFGDCMGHSEFDVDGGAEEFEGGAVSVKVV